MLSMVAGYCEDLCVLGRNGYARLRISFTLPAELFDSVIPQPVRRRMMLLRILQHHLPFGPLLCQCQGPM